MNEVKRAFCLLACLAVAFAVPPTRAEEDSFDFADQVGTMTLDQELDARGNLGGVAVDQLGFIYVANFRDAVWRISPDGEVLELTRSLYGSSGNAVDARGDLYQANFNGNSIARLARTGEIDLVATDGLAGPVGIVFGPDGSLYICNCSGNYLSRMTPDGSVEKFAESDFFACPNGITLGGDGWLYVTNFNNHEILRVAIETPNEGPQPGTVERFVTVPGGAGNAHIAFSRGFFYVTKIISNQIVKISPYGEFVLLAGTGQSGHEDGNAEEATFFRPNGIAVSPQGGRLYVNTMIGKYSQPEKSQLTLRTIDLVTLTRVLDNAMAEGGLETATAAYNAYKADPVRGQEITAGEMITYAYRFLSARMVPEALAFFTLNAESYPEVASPHFHLGEAHRYIGQTEEAIARYRKALEIDPEHAASSTRLKQLETEAPEEEASQEE